MPDLYSVILERSIHCIFHMKNIPIRFLSDKDRDVSFLESLLRDRKRYKREIEWALSGYKDLAQKLQKPAKVPSTSRLVQEYVDIFYARNGAQMHVQLKRIRFGWEKQRRKRFYQLVRKLFGDTAFPPGKYVAYGTMWHLYPRFLEDKTFFIPWKYTRRDFIYVVIAHEMLHFKFFDFFKKHYSTYKDPEHSLFVWHVSEIFNILVQNSSPWMSVFHKRAKLYPEHVSVVRSLRQWQKKQSHINIDLLIQKIVTTLKNRKAFYGNDGN